MAQNLDIQDIKSQLFKNGYVIIKDIDLDPVQQVNLTKEFGNLINFPFEFKRHRAQQEIILVSNLNDDGSIKISTFGTDWHNDGDFWDNNYIITLLHSKQIPSTGGSTFFFDLRAAYDKLSDEKKELIKNVKLEVSVDDVPDFNNSPAEIKSQFPRVFHPIAFKHKINGRTGLYLGGRTTKIEGMSTEESTKLLSELIAIGAENCYQHIWNPNELIIWDNTQVMHMAEKYVGNEPRVLWRTQAQLNF
jgi:alpha-ketoglutarate-dependent taurine dioxygenase